MGAEPATPRVTAATSVEAVPLTVLHRLRPPKVTGIVILLLAQSSEAAADGKASIGPRRDTEPEAVLVVAGASQVTRTQMGL